MECEFERGATMNKKRLFAILLSLCILVSCFSGCTLRDTSIFYKEITMQCDDPYMITTYKDTENGVGIRETYLEIDGDICRVELHYRSTIFVVQMLDPLSLDAEVLLSGTWKEKDGNLILYIDDDYIFDNQYEKIVLKPVDSTSTS